MTTMTRTRSRRVPPQRGDAAKPADPKSAARPPRRYELDTSLRLVTPAERAAKGRQLRTEVPRSSHAGFEPSATRPDPVDVLASQSASRLADLIPIRDGRMLASPFSYFRGSALPMAYDLSGTPATRLGVQPCRHARLGKLGLFASTERPRRFQPHGLYRSAPGTAERDL